MKVYMDFKGDLYVVKSCDGYFVLTFMNNYGFIMNVFDTSIAFKYRALKCLGDL